MERAKASRDKIAHNGLPFIRDDDVSSCYSLPRAQERSSTNYLSVERSFLFTLNQEL